MNLDSLLFLLVVLSSFELGTYSTAFIVLNISNLEWTRYWL